MTKTPSADTAGGGLRPPRSYLERVLAGWLRRLELAGSQLLSQPGRARLRRLAEKWAQPVRPAGRDKTLTSCSPAELQAAAQALRRSVRSVSVEQEELATRAGLLALARALRATAGKARSAQAPHKPVGFPAAALAQAAKELERARSEASVARAAISAAVAISGASGGIWWDCSHDGGLTATLARGRSLPDPPLSFRLEPGPAPTGPWIDLSSWPDYAAVLSWAKARRAVLVPVRVGGRWVAALTVHDGALNPTRLHLLVALAQQAAAALRLLGQAVEGRRVARSQERLLSQLATAFGSALSLDELLSVGCEFAIGMADADACLLFLAEDGSALQLRAQAGERLRDAQAVSEASQLAELTRADPRGELLWRATSPRGPAWIALQSARFARGLGLALSIRGEALGALMLFRTQPRAFTNKQRQAMRSFAAQAAIAIENLHLFEDTQRRLLEMADLTWVSNRISASRDLAGIAATITGAAAKAVNVPLAAVLLAQPNGRCEPVPGGQFGLHDDGRGHLPAQGHVGAEALEAGAPQAVADAEQEGRAGDALVRWLGARSVLCVPVTGHQGLRSLFVVGDHRPRVFRSHTVALVSNYANQAALALQSALLAREEEKHHAGLAKLYEVSQALASSLDLTETLNTVLNSAADLLEAPVCSVMLMDFEAGELVIKAARGFWPDDALYERIKPGSGLAGRAVQSGMALTSSDISRDGRFRFRERAREGGLRTAAAAPLVARGRTLGVISVYRKTDREFTEEEKRLLMSLANSAAVAIENANLYREAQEKAQFLSAMMSEINQRIRNTLQAIAGLLRMEMERPLAGSAQAALKRGIARIQSAAVVHELLRARELQFVDMKQVAERVFQLTSQSLTDECRAEVKITGARVMLPSQKATSAALILAELIDNSLRHGLADHASGRLAISLVEAGGNVVIQVKDNGPGLPASFDLDSNAGLGLKIVRGLVEQELGGVLEVDGREGLLVRARFPKSA